MSSLFYVVTQSFEVRFASLFTQGRALAFPCDAKGCVDLDALPDRAKNNYLFARAMVGRDYSTPCICQSSSAEACKTDTDRLATCRMCGPRPSN
jgi:hypothetical protein